MSTISKIIFQTSIKKPESYIIDKILSHCPPDWTYLHFNDEEAISFLKENYLEEFKNIVYKFNQMPSGAHKADLFRYYFLYIKGGVFIDSDAMIETNIENVIQDYHFFSVQSLEPDLIFQGFIGCTPGNVIVYEALQYAYDINIEHLKSYYFLFCRILHNIVHSEAHSSSDNKIKLYNERHRNNDCAETYDENNQILLIHYYRHKTIPK
jgi:mannosyltransferase OCH1-like enzyme